jgi:pyridoxal phosphate enzyme (YggS family)
MDSLSYQEVVERVAAAASRADRRADEVTLVAVSKTKSADEIRAVYDLGHRVFGENRAQELAAKAPELPRDLQWHFVGELQSNKARVVRPIVELLHSMDRESLAAAWLKGIGLAPPVLIEVNMGEEVQKGGVSPENLRPVAGRLVEMGLDVRGLMAIPPIPDVAEDSRPYFSRLRDLRDSLVGDLPQAKELSMGMTDDFEVAIEEGASIIRVGRAIFGPRN